jgi:hypothetical protein
VLTSEEEPVKNEVLDPCLGFCTEMHENTRQRKTKEKARAQTNKQTNMFSSISFNNRKEEDPMETIAREFDREDAVAKLERECEALEDMEKKYQEELKEKKLEEEEKKSTLEKELKKAKEREEELRHLQEEMDHQETEIVRLREELRRATFENLRKEEEKRKNRLKLLEEYEALASQMEEVKKYPEEIKKEEEKMNEVEAKLKKMCEGKFGDVKIEKFEDFGEEINAQFDRIIAKEKNLQEKTLLAANELLTKKGGAFAHDVNDRKRKEPMEKEEEEEGEGEPATLVGENKQEAS